jgi:hypothetical protein
LIINQGLMIIAIEDFLRLPNSSCVSQGCTTDVYASGYRALRD